MQQATMEAAVQTSAVPAVNADQRKPSSGLTAAQYIVEQLAEWGVARIYGVIGDANLDVLDALAKQNRIAYVACQHEESAALMASAEAKLTGQVGVCMATSGPGAANLLNGVADAAMDYVPLLVLTGQVETYNIGTRAKQYIDQQKLFSGVTDCSELVTHPDALPELLQTALTTAITQGKPAHLSIAKNMYRLPVNGTVKPYPRHLKQELLVPDEPVREAAELIRGAARPVLLIGRGVSGAAAEVIRLAEQLPAAIVTTLPARPLVPNDHLHYAGGLGQAGSEAASVLLSESDLIVMLGATWWPDEYVPSQARVLQIDKIPAQIGQGHPLTRGIAGDAADIVPRLVRELEQSPAPNRLPWKARIAEVNAAWKGRIEAEANQKTEPLAPQLAVKLVAEACAENAVVTVDTGDHTLWFNRIFQAKRGQSVLLSGRWRTLGFALPAAIAAKLAQPRRQVVALAGDGGVVQTIMELRTAARMKLAFTLVIFDNGSYAMERNRMSVQGLNTLGSELESPDFVKLAESCGASGYRVTTEEEWEKALQLAANSSDVPVVIVVKVADTMVPHTK
ncbi:thiamine pyrophosphate-binding protein [Paenibacillus chartarius]|uniref:Thiamine pyrophosphate-binding protein n=1 Tax=Paenibacillus chartarius TaxID=747481 RepID=A0ABV6DUZ3_9BACL